MVVIVCLQVGIRAVKNSDGPVGKEEKRRRTDGQANKESSSL